MAVEFSRSGRLAYGAILLALSIYILTGETFTLRNTTFDGLELYILSAAFFLGFVDMIFSAIFDYDSKNLDHPFRWHHYSLMAISITLIVLAVVFTFLEDEIFNLPEGL